ncbi:MAG: 4-hydroxy-tetrahydrodipicolinate synthase [Oscillospiraceae bacterium]|nr:4-hydroxy-tetrahydrodipicolinate synthase [Oscillospiraceae bacterium]
MKEPIFRGVATALITPFTDDGIDFPALEQLLIRQLDAKIPALVICGTTGEASTLSREEKAQLWMYCVHFVDGACKIIAGIGSNNTLAAAELAQTAERCGVDALLAVTPYYNKCTQEGLLEHYLTIANRSALPLITYNVPSRTGTNMTHDCCRILSTHPRINGIKDASGNISQTAKLCALPNCYVWSGNDDQIVPTLSLGGCGIISVLSNLCPEVVHQITSLCFIGQYKKAAALQLQYLPLIDALFCEVNPIPIKAALASQGLCRENLRLPLTPLSDAGRKELFSAMEKCFL